MPKPQNPGVEQNSQLISISEPFGGWVTPLSGTSSVPHYVGSVEGVEASLTKQQTNQYAESDGISLFHFEKFGHLAPGYGYSVGTDAGSKINDLPLNGDSTSVAAAAAVVLQNGRVVQIDPSSAAVSQTLFYDPTSHTPVSSTNGDMIVFRDYAATSVEWVIWSWEWSGNGEVSIIKSSDLGNAGSTAVDGWYTGITNHISLTKGVPHKLGKGPDGNIYVLDGAFVQQITLASTLGLSSANAVWGNRLPLGPGWIATGICAFKNYVAIIASSKVANALRGQTRVFFWDGLTSTVNGVTSVAPNYIFDLPDNFGNGIFFDGNSLFAFTNGRNNSSKIFTYSSKGFVKDFETPFITPSTTPIQGSVEYFQDGLMIGAVKNSDAKSFRYYRGGFHDEGFLQDGASNFASSVGMVKNLQSNLICYGVNYSSTYKIFITNSASYQFSANSSPTIDFRTILYTSGILGRRLYPMGFKMNVTRIKIFLSQWGTGAALTLSLFEGYNAMVVGGANDRLNKTLDTTTYQSGTNEIDLNDLALTDISSFYMNIRWMHTTAGATPAIIRRIEVYVSQS